MLWVYLYTLKTKRLLRKLPYLKQMKTNKEIKLSARAGCVSWCKQAELLEYNKLNKIH